MSTVLIETTEGSVALFNFDKKKLHSLTPVGDSSCNLIYDGLRMQINASASDVTFSLIVNEMETLENRLENDLMAKILKHLKDCNYFTGISSFYITDDSIDLEDPSTFQNGVCTMMSLTWRLEGISVYSNKIKLVYQVEIEVQHRDGGFFSSLVTYDRFHVLTGNLDADVGLLAERACRKVVLKFLNKYESDNRQNGLDFWICNSKRGGKVRVYPNFLDFEMSSRDELECKRIFGYSSKEKRDNFFKCKAFYESLLDQKYEEIKEKITLALPPPKQIEQIKWIEFKG